ncbi:hypothetical protein QQS21_012165 [Conoideocrella luteorostrata]|uniref:Flap structure-specific endonuclease n=1 Tax=Conoideocrella luteorostrata TaxID=1105319 RepID=A0AAJ0CBQ3_9HYPO|nr:hypothetical protein QQS21_012165 [Conoideocrella luteorostrata]
MGIKGIYGELGQGKRISLSKLAADSFESKNRPYRIAIDIAIWQFQTQAARGGTNPAIRTLFYRLVRLLATPIQPIFVFDGPHKPAFKRNKRSGRGDGVATAMAKRLIRLFGFPVHDAPGEAEAECALLQRHGVVDAVLSEDVDTIMFGCTQTLRNWSSEGRTSKTPTHVSLYDVHDMKLKDLGLDREGMVLVALMSGGDYLPDGIRGCGVKVACEAAKAGFGKSICRLKASDKEGIQAWRKAVIHELHTNEKRYFRTKHKALKIPEDFPNLEVLRYYTHPVVSAESSIPGIRQKLEQKSDIHLEALREFTRETFDWDYRIGAIKFVRVLSQALLVQKMTEKSDGRHVKRISGRRTHFSTDGMPEIRVAYVPEEVVPIDLSKEVDEVISYDRNGLALNSDEEIEATETVDDIPTRTPKVFDITKPDLAWVLEGLMRRSAPVALHDWQEKERAKTVRQSPTKKKAAAGKSSKTSDMPRGSFDKYVRITKASAAVPVRQVLSKLPLDPSPSPPQSPTRPQARRPSPSKQTSPSPTRSPVKKSAVQAINSSPVTPRSSEIQRQPEAIYISSSPPSASNRSPLRPSSGAISASSKNSQLPESVRSIIQKSSSQALKPLLQRRRQNTKQGVDSQATRCLAMKQSSLEAFVITSKMSLKVPEQEDKHIDMESDSDLDSLPSFTQAKPSEKADSPDTTITRQEHEPKQTASSPKKRLFRPRLSAAGYFEEVELNAGERDAQIVSKGGKTSSVVRWSDVSIVDLTGDGL